MKTFIFFLFLLTVVCLSGCNSVATNPDFERSNQRLTQQNRLLGEDIESYRLNDAPAASYSYNSQQSTLFSNAWPMADQTSSQTSQKSTVRRHIEGGHLAAPPLPLPSLEITSPTRLSTNRETGVKAPATQVASLGFFSDSISESQMSQTTSQRSVAEKTRPVDSEEAPKSTSKKVPKTVATEQRQTTQPAKQQPRKSQTKKTAMSEVKQIIARIVAQIRQKANRSGKKTISRKNDLWHRIRKGYGLPDIDNVQIQNEIAEYLLYPSYFEKIATNASPFLYHIVEELEKRHMPLELALLPAIESRYQPTASSHKNAAGLWQFIPSTGKHYGLTRNEWYDDRGDSIASTRAALTYLQRLHRMFDGDWFLALAAYNYGPGNVRKAIQKSLKPKEPAEEPKETEPPKELADSTETSEPSETQKESGEPSEKSPVQQKPDSKKSKKASESATVAEQPTEEPTEPLKPDFWSLKLPKETREYVPKLLALSKIIANPEQYGIQLKTIANQPHLRRVRVKRQMELSLAAQLADMSEDEFKRLNARYIGSATVPKETYYLTLPIAKVRLFKQRLAKIPANVSLVQTTEPKAEAEQVATSSKTDDSKKTSTAETDSKFVTSKAATHQVREGESFWTIARQYGTTVGELRQLNPLESPFLKVGHLLKLPADVVTPAKAASTKEESDQSAEQVVTSSKTDDSKKTSTAETDSKSVTSKAATHQVREGESFWTIARQYGTTVGELRQLNPLESPFLKVGHLLKLPADVATPVKVASTKEEPSQLAEQVVTSSKTDDSKKTSTAETDSKSVTSKAATHQVREGESFWTIARQYGTSVAQLRQLNPLESSFLKVGHLLKLPADVATPVNEESADSNTTKPKAEHQSAEQVVTSSKTDDSKKTSTAETDSKSVTSKAATHQVREGESFWTIARQYGTTVAQLQLLNPLESSFLKVGHLLKLPADVATPVNEESADSNTTKPKAEHQSAEQVVTSSKTDDSKKTSTAETDSKSVTSKAATHQVREGESFWTIARQYGTTVAQLQLLNPLESSFLKVGHLLKLPSTEAAVKPKEVLKPGQKKIIHTVKSGENLWEIARHYQVTIDKLSQWNSLDKQDFLKSGQKLTIWLDET
jgi:LysM repeat protein